MIALGIILMIVGIITVIIAVVAEICDWNCCITALGWFAGALFTLGASLLIISSPNDKPTAMDVYQGKTSLQYTIVDSVKIDSVVVWKIKEK